MTTKMIIMLIIIITTKWTVCKMMINLEVKRR